MSQQESESELNQSFLRKVWLILLFSSLPLWCGAGLAHQNQLVIQKDTPQSLQFEFTVNPCQMLHEWLAPTIPFAVFLQKYADLNDDAFNKEITKSIKKFESENFVVQTSGAKQSLKVAEFPRAPELKNLLKQNLFILDLPSNLQAHVEPMVLRATLKTRAPLQRVQLFISPSVFPIQIRYAQDQLWFTSQIPMALFDF